MGTRVAQSMAMKSLKMESVGRFHRRGNAACLAARLVTAGALGALALSSSACGGPGDGTDNTNESTENVADALHGPRVWRGVLAGGRDAGAATTATAAAGTTASSAGASAATGTAPATGGSAVDAAAFYHPPTGDFGSCPAMVQQIGFGVCDSTQILETCTLSSGTLCECIRVDGEGQSAEIVCPAPGL